MIDDNAIDQDLRRWGADARTAAPPVSIPEVTVRRRSMYVGWPAVAAAAVAVALIAAAVSNTLARSDNQASDPLPRAPSVVTPATAAEGTRAVVFHGLAVDVPLVWSNGQAECGVAIENTVLLDGPTNACGVGELPPVSSVSLRRFTGGSIPTLPKACCDFDGSTTTAPTPIGETFAIGDAPATRYRSEPSPEEPFFTETITVESRQAAIIVRSPDAATVTKIAASLRLEKADPNGCVSATEHANFAPPVTASSNTPKAPVQPLIPGVPASLTVCRYLGGWIEQSSRLTADDAANLVALVNDAPEGTSTSGSGMGTCQPTTSGTDTVVASENEGFVITASYSDREPVVMAAQISCGPFGLYTGSSTRQMTSDIASALVSAAGASQGWPMAFYPNP